MLSLQELMDKYDNDHDGRLSMDEYLGEFSLKYLLYFLLRRISIDCSKQSGDPES